MARNEKDFDVPTGETFRPTLRWGSGVYATKAITAITKAAPAVVTATAHDMPNGWPCAVVGVQGMTQINATRYPPQGGDWHFGTATDANTVQFNDVSSADFSAYTSGGFLVYDTPSSLLSVTVVMTIYSTPEFIGTPLAVLTSDDPATMALDNTLKTITPILQTAGLAWSAGYYRVDATDIDLNVKELLRGVINIV